MTSTTMHGGVLFLGTPLTVPQTTALLLMVGRLLEYGLLVLHHDTAFTFPKDARLFPVVHDSVDTITSISDFVLAFPNDSSAALGDTIHRCISRGTPVRLIYPDGVTTWLSTTIAIDPATFINDSHVWGSPAVIAAYDASDPR